MVQLTLAVSHVLEGGCSTEAAVRRGGYAAAAAGAQRASEVSCPGLQASRHRRGSGGAAAHSVAGCSPALRREPCAVGRRRWGGGGGGPCGCGGCGGGGGTNAGHSGRLGGWGGLACASGACGRAVCGVVAERCRAAGAAAAALAVLASPVSIASAVQVRLWSSLRAVWAWLNVGP